MVRDLLFAMLILAVCSMGCGLFSSNTDDAEIVFPATEVGLPEGPNITKDIGPAGGTLSSDLVLVLGGTAKALGRSVSGDGDVKIHFTPLERLESQKSINETSRKSSGFGVCANLRHAFFNLTTSIVAVS